MHLRDGSVFDTFYKMESFYQSNSHQRQEMRVNLPAQFPVINCVEHLAILLNLVEHGQGFINLLIVNHIFDLLGGRVAIISYHPGHHSSLSEVWRV
jgi:hypothetical protein